MKISHIIRLSIWALLLPIILPLIVFILFSYFCAEVLIMLTYFLINDEDYRVNKFESLCREFNNMKDIILDIFRER